jgi:serine/threonine protein kinase
MMIDGEKRAVHENILREKIILKYLGRNKQCSQSVVKYVDFMKSNVNYYLVMSDGGHCLFDFNLKVHEYIESGKIQMAHWHKLVKVILRRMMDCLECIHSMKVCHFDISLENFLINDLDVEYGADETLSFCFDGDDAVQIKLCDFGLAECFETGKSDRGGSDCNDDHKEETVDFRSDKYCGKRCYQSPEITNREEEGTIFDAKKNDVWCLGVCLWMLITGSSPFQSSIAEDPYFQLIINGKMEELLTKWKKAHYVDEQLLEIFGMLFQYENERADIAAIKSCAWLNESQ